MIKKKKIKQYKKDFLIKYLINQKLKLNTKVMIMQIKSIFNENEYIPKKYTCKGEDINPPLYIENVPNDSESLVLIIDDPDAPNKTWVHWVVWNIDPKIKEIKENSIPGKQGINDFGKYNYGGPCPPSGTHRYLFKLYALDKKVNLNKNTTKKELLKEIEGSIIEKTKLVGLFSN
ncbi:MAG: YbhB/YbcL family Raf kinase inhibitor-like protein [Candidatus Woesearchaeota archaeon]